ncbi:MAG: hypothetical protein A2W23_05125 [Planctomycetes bacterium RBG_16_43_13]|nr:MAG: hypothetical protein A2W23_05125 [Planctomycetes bacterium RBG_16_43_13]
MIIRLIKTHNEYLVVEKLQKATWQFQDREIIPINELVTAQNNGGVVLGAFDRECLIGFCFGLAGFSPPLVYHCSRMLAVLPKYQHKNIGYKLKLAQRKFALKQGLRIIKWTFDPLQSRNAYFNIVKLGVIVRQYVVNLYGYSSSRFNQGFETDRLIPEWFIDSKRVKKILSGDMKIGNLCDYNAVLETTARKDGFRVPQEARLNLKDKKLAVEIPFDIDKLKAKDVKLAQKWRQYTRIIFQHYFNAGYMVVSFIVKDSRSFYLLERVKPLN